LSHPLSRPLRSLNRCTSGAGRRPPIRSEHTSALARFLDEQEAGGSSQCLAPLRRRRFCGRVRCGGFSGSRARRQCRVRGACRSRCTDMTGVSRKHLHASSLGASVSADVAELLMPPIRKIESGRSRFAVRVAMAKAPDRWESRVGLEQSRPCVVQQARA
jgi:hypothetical protein